MNSAERKCLKQQHILCRRSISALHTGICEKTAQREISYLVLAEEILQKASKRIKEGNSLALNDVMVVYKAVLKSKGLDHEKDTKLYKLLLKLTMNREIGWKNALLKKKAVILSAITLRAKTRALRPLRTA